jgi:hypothetical protein
MQPAEQPIWIASLWQPWADLVCPNIHIVDLLRSTAPEWAEHLPKDVENRTRRIHHRGLLAIHAAAGRVDRPLMAQLNLDPRRFVRGAIVGVVDLVGCSTNDPSWWATDGAVNWKVARPRRLLSPIVTPGPQSARTITDPGVLRELHRQLDAGMALTLEQQADFVPAPRAVALETV